MLVVLVLVLGLAIFLASVMFKSANKAADKIEAKTDSVLSAADNGSPSGAVGSRCASDSECQSGICDTYSKTCS